MRPGQVILRFQFHYGTIKRVEGRAGQSKAGDFNSTMVRLKAFARTLPVNTASLFQFHYGTIKRFVPRNYAKFSIISIPLWYD